MKTAFPRSNLRLFGASRHLKQNKPAAPGGRSSMAGLVLVFTIISSVMFQGPFVFTRMCRASGDANTIAGLSKQLDNEFTVKADALKTISIAEENAAPKEKELKLWHEQEKVIAPQVESYKQRYEQHQKDAAVVNQKVGAHNAVCSGSLPKPQYEKCKGEEPYLQSQIDRINSSKRQLDTERTNLQKRIDAIIKRVDELTRELGNIYNTRNNAKKRLNAAENRISELKGRLQNECKNAKTPEAISHCGQVDWDGARRNLPDGSQHKPGGTPFFGK